jgi:hypothetical protein
MEVYMKIRDHGLLGIGTASLASMMQSLILVMFAAMSVARSDRAAATTVWSATVVGVTVDPGYGNFAFIKLSVAPTGLACGTDTNYHYTLSFTGTANQQLYALLLAAYMSGKTVAVTGQGSCNEAATVESLRGLDVIG